MDWSTALVLCVSIICATIILVYFFAPSGGDTQEDLIRAEADKEAYEDIAANYKDQLAKANFEIARLQRLLVPSKTKVEDEKPV